MSGANAKSKLVVISGPSGVGKSTICDELLQRLPNAWLSVSATTRKKTEAETDGEDYYFFSEEQFQEKIAKGEFLEYAQVFDNYYGTPRESVERALAEGKTVILEIDVQGGLQVKNKMPSAELIFVLPPKRRELEKRINGRARDDSEAIEQRLAGASRETAAAWQYYNHMVINDKLETAVDEIVEILGTV